MKAGVRFILDNPEGATLHIHKFTSYGTSAMTDVLDRPSLRRELDETQAEIAATMRLIADYYEAIDTLAAKVNRLEERAASLGEALIAQS